MIIKRFVAYLIDIMIASGILYLYAIYFGTKDKVSGGYSFNGAWGWLIGFGILFLYFFLQEFYWKKTIGKRLFNLEVVKVDSSKLEASDVFKRRILDILELYFIPLIAFITPLTNKKEQRLGDKWANTMVVTVKKRT